MKGRKDRIENLDLHPISAARITSTQFLTEEERKRYLRLWKIMYIVIPLLYFFLTLIFH